MDVGAYANLGNAKSYCYLTFVINSLYSERSIPSTFESLIKHPGKMITSLGQCCNIMQSEDVTLLI